MDSINFKITRIEYSIEGEPGKENLLCTVYYKGKEIKKNSERHDVQKVLISPALKRAAELILNCGTMPLNIIYTGEISKKILSIKK